MTQAPSVRACRPQNAIDIACSTTNNERKRRLAYMIRLALSVVGVLLFSAHAWGMQQPGACGGHSRALSSNVLGPQMCLLLQDPWQDCGEDPWQLSSVQSASDTFSDPWQDADDPWQPFPAVLPAGATPDAAVDPWQPLVSQL
jgi:hypothetical protein